MGLTKGSVFYIDLEISQGNLLFDGWHIYNCGTSVSEARISKTDHVKNF